MDAYEDVDTFSVVTSSQLTSSTNAAVTIVLWFNFTIYECEINPSSRSSTYTCNSNQFIILGQSDCGKPHYNNIPKAKFLIDNPSTDAVGITSVVVNTTYGHYFGANSVCIGPGENPLNSGTCYDNNPSWIISDTICGSGYVHYDRIYCDNQMSDCGPQRQIFNLDITRPNEYISDSLWEDGTNILPDIKSCNPTTDPTANPTVAPSKNPTKSPTVYPTSSPSTNPTNNPTILPSISPTKYPSFLPSTKYPSFPPSTMPTDYVTSFTSAAPTLIPTVNPNHDLDGSVVGHTTTSIDYFTTGAENKLTTNNWSNSVFLWIMIALLGSCIICGSGAIAYICHLYWNKKDKTKRQTEMINIKEKPIQIETLTNTTLTETNTVLMNTNTTPNVERLELHSDGGEIYENNNNETTPNSIDQQNDEESGEELYQTEHISTTKGQPERTPL